jgi:hypothetical protein
MWGNSVRVLVALSLAVVLVPCMGEEFADQPPDRLSVLVAADELLVYDDEFASLAGQLARARDWGGLIFVFTQCHSGGMLDDLAEALEGLGPVALLAACRYDEVSWMAASTDPPGCLSGCRLAEPESYNPAALARFLAKGISLETAARKAAVLDAAAPGRPATDPQICPGESRVDPPEHPQWTFSGGGGGLILGRDPTGQPLSSDQLVGVLIVGDADTVAMWNDLERYYSLLLQLGFHPDNVLVLAGPGPGQEVELVDPEGTTVTVPPFADGPGYRSEILSSLEWAFDRISPGGQLFFWYTGHGTELPAFSWSQALDWELGTSLVGELSPQDLTMPDGSKYDLYAFSVSTPSQVTITLSSQDFDAFLWLFDAGRQLVASDDDSGGDLNARITAELAPGVYYLVANAYAEGELGEYTLAGVLGSGGPRKEK